MEEVWWLIVSIVLEFLEPLVEYLLYAMVLHTSDAAMQPLSPILHCHGKSVEAAVVSQPGFKRWRLTVIDCSRGHSLPCDDWLAPR
jgi:hypothetical protein